MNPFTTVAISLAVLASTAAHARVVNFDFDDAQADVEVFPGVTANATIDLVAKGRVEINPGIWMRITAKSSGGANVDGHVNNSGLGGVGEPGGNQISAAEVVTLGFFDAQRGGSPVVIDLNRINLGTFGGTATAAAGDGITVSAGAIPDFNVSGNTNTAGSGWSYNQLNPTTADGDGEIVFTPAVPLSSLTLTDDSSGQGGSRLQRIAFNEDPTDPDPDPSAPNIVFIIVDDMGYSDVGCYGGEIDTPNIDSLAADGLRFRQFYNNAKCETSRSCLMSGLYHGRSGLQMQNGSTLAEAARSGGYRTFASGKWHLGTAANGRHPTNRGFHHFYGFYGGSSNYFPSGISATTVSLDTAESSNFVSAYPLTHFTPDPANPNTLSKQTSFPAGYYMTDAIGDHAVSFINDSNTNHPDRPFFLYLSFNAPHTPLQAPVPLINKYRNTYKTKGWDVLRREKWQRQIASGIADPQWQLSNYRKDIPRWDELDAAARDIEDHRRAVYAAMIDSVDQNVGKVLDRIDALGLTNDTIVMFCSDNGAQAFDNPTAGQRAVSPSDPDSRWNPGAAWAAYSNSPFRYHKQAQHQGGICAPLIVRWPGVVAPGGITDEPGHVVDIMATIVDIGVMDYASLTTSTGAPAPPMDGGSLRTIFDGTGRSSPDFWGFEFDRKDFAVIQGDWKLVSFRSSPWRLFNLADDRTETRNLAREYPGKVRAMATLYDQWAGNSYGNATRNYANRLTISELGNQHMRYETAATGALYRQPPVACTVADIGTLPTSTVFEKHEVWTVQCAGPQIGGTDDSFNLTSLPFFGDGELLVRLESVTNSTATGMAGIMIRESAAADSPFVMTRIDPAGNCTQLLRASAGQNATSTRSTSFSTPVFLRLSRSGNTFTSSASADGLAWTTIATRNLALGPKLIAGLASSSGSSATQATIIYREWEHLDLGQYPEQFRLIDGLPAALAYAFGASPDVSALDRLPVIQPGKGSPTFPELVIHRRLDLTGLNVGIEESTNLTRWNDDTANWTEISQIDLPDGSGERVTLRRNTSTTTVDTGFFRLSAGIAP